MSKPHKLTHNEAFILSEKLKSGDMICQRSHGLIARAIRLFGDGEWVPNHIAPVVVRVSGRVMVEQVTKRYGVRPENAVDWLMRNHDIKIMRHPEPFDSLAFRLEMERLEGREYPKIHEFIKIAWKGDTSGDRRPMCAETWLRGGLKAGAAIACDPDNIHPDELWDISSSGGWKKVYDARSY